MYFLIIIYFLIIKGNIFSFFQFIQIKSKLKSQQPTPPYIIDIVNSYLQNCNEKVLIDFGC